MKIGDIFSKLLGESAVFDIHTTKKVISLYKMICKKINVIKFTPTDDNDFVTDSTGKKHLLLGVKFNLTILGYDYDLEILLVNKIGRNPAPFYSNNKIVFFIITQTNDPSDFENNLAIAKLRFKSWVSQDVFVHEFTHYLDALRYSDSYAHTEHKELNDYYNSPEEYNAFYKEIVNRLISNKKVATLDFTSFFKKAMSYGDTTFIKNLTPENKNKLTSRLYKLYSELR